jgi:hypothetical protein
MRKLFLTLAACIAGALFAAPAAFAADFTLHGGAQAEIGDVKLVSDLSNAPTTDNSSWIDFTVPAGLKLSDLATLSTQFNVTDDDCGGGSPRFQINVDGKNVFVYLGPSPSFTGCAKDTWLSSGNLVGTSDACRVDTSQLISGTQCTTWAAALAALGTHTVTGIQLTVDSGWFFADKEQTVLVRNVTINGNTFITPQQPSKGNPAKLCAAQRASLGKSAFNELWGTNGNDRNAFGKCVSAMARAKHAGNASSVQSTILTTAQTCASPGLRGERLGACVSARDGLAATPADPAGKGKKKKHHRR